MTPTERAERELRDFWRPDASKEKDARRLLAIFRDTIRDAEEDVIEEAATLLARRFGGDEAETVRRLRPVSR